MPFLVKVPKPCQCAVPPTDSEFYDVGTRWQCERCGAIYELSYTREDVNFRECVLYWRRETR